MKSFKVEPSNYRDAFLKGNKVRFAYKSYKSSDLEEIYSISRELLHYRHVEDLYSFVKTALKELVQNAVKATQKRVFFIANNIDFFTNYDKGLIKFKEALANSLVQNYSLPDSVEFTAEVIFKNEPTYILLTVRNMGELHKHEKENITVMLERGKFYSQVSDLLTEETKHKEGGGLGLSMIVILMKNLNIPLDNLYFESKEGFTVFTLKIPCEP